MNPAPALVLLSVAALLTSCGSDPTSSGGLGAEFASGGSGPSAGGHVERDLPEFGVPVEKYSFNAHYLGNGSVGGRFVVRDVFADGSETIKLRGRVKCFTVEPDGKTARMGGVIEGGDAGGDVTGFEAVWTVRDNGEGGDDPRDQATDLRFAFPPDGGVADFHCAVGFPPEAFGTFGDNLRGNVQVRP